MWVSVGNIIYLCKRAFVSAGTSELQSCVYLFYSIAYSISVGRALGVYVVCPRVCPVLGMEHDTSLLVRSCY